MAYDKSIQHEMLAIFVQVFEKLGYIPTRDEFIQYSNLTQSSVVNAFGSYTDLVNASGLAPKRIVKTYGEKRFDREKLNFSDIENIYDKFQIEIKPYFGKFDREHKDHVIIMTITDMHSVFQDPFTWFVFLETVKRIQPDIIILGGDILDFYRISFHSKDPGRALKMQDEIDFVVHNVLEKLRQLCPKAQIDYHMGNHEFRLFRYLCEQAPALSSLRDLQFHKLLDLDRLEINLVARENFTFQPKKDKENYKIYLGKWSYTHGTDTSQFPALKELNEYVMSGASGHVHRLTYKAKRSLYGFNSWVSCPSSCTLENGKEFMPNMFDWEQGFLITHITKYGVTQTPVLTTNGFCEVGGIYYKK